MRILVADDRARELLTRSAVARSLPEMSRGGRATLAQGCHAYRLVDAARFPDGGPVTPADVVASWRRELARGSEPHRWLLSPLADSLDRADADASGSGLRLSTDELVLCPPRPLPDLDLRLAHPALWIRRPAAGGGGVEGPGGFVADARGGLAPNPATERPPRVDPVELAVGEDPFLRFRLGQTDLAVLHGRAASQVRGLGEETGAVLERLVTWDRTYGMWLNPRARWINDPSFRRWMANVIDREAMASYLFEGAASPALGLLEPGRSEPGWEPVPSRPISRGTVPRWTLLYDDGDLDAARIAARIKATLAAGDVELRIEPRPLDTLRHDVNAGVADAALIRHVPGVADPALALQETLWPIREAVPGVWQILEGATLLGESRDRRDAALAAEQALLADATLIPLVRVEAWLARDPRLLGVVAGPVGVLDLAEAGWSP